MERNNEKVLKFLPISSFVHNDFWHKYVDIKMDIDRLDENGRPIQGFLQLSQSSLPLLQIDCSSLNSTTLAAHRGNDFVCKGIFLNYNTIESFKQCDKKILLKEHSQRIYKELVNQQCLANSLDILKFLVISFSDLKGYKFYYWFAFPVPANLIYSHQRFSSLPASIADGFKQHFLEWVESSQQNYKGLTEIFFIYKPNVGIGLLQNYIRQTEPSSNFHDENLENIYFCFYDTTPCANDDLSSPLGWHVRQFLFYLTITCPNIAEKTTRWIRVCNASPGEFSFFSASITLPKHISNLADIDDWVGWEINDAGRYAPRFVSLVENMAPKCVAENAINLNLRLMKWRLVPTLDLKAINTTRCLLLGAGTLGCNVARSLMAWGINTITFVDYGRVSFSNPVRQTLYRYEDALNGGKPKASTAADRLKEINPAITASGENILIPMPGHPVDNTTGIGEIKAVLEKMTKLIEEHDVIFLLTDSRESRWLPSMLAAFHGKLAINAALGFDSYVVMRHGYRSSKLQSQGNMQDTSNGFIRIDGGNLGCYFCNDVVAPGNSLKDRTLDQQCTVTRPAVSSIAAGLAVELMVSLVQHAQGFGAPAYYRTPRSDPASIGQEPEGILGILPHSIRGNISTQSTMITATERFKKCVACSSFVIDRYSKEKEAFIIEVLNSAKTLEVTVGLDYSITPDKNDDKQFPTAIRL
ncbi:ubiquitin-like modifier-activating enzyme ATG7 isoform X2 [Anopheles aquasalis]|uniref:ubiquitin-like modifier-activating enzyme ATG7 isoform X2 n=1 Tax=Anopheles aquasalis TaxID=42839 RepID=UPI00215AA810|nr:ubiquitin-like modifier-activating enzyme ATG7 isoform X2 [Anopheles aquasalis]